MEIQRAWQPLETYRKVVLSFNMRYGFPKYICYLFNKSSSLFSFFTSAKRFEYETDIYVHKVETRTSSPTTNIKRYPNTIKFSNIAQVNCNGKVTDARKIIYTKLKAYNENSLQKRVAYTNTQLLLINTKVTNIQLNIIIGDLSIIIILITFN